MAPEAAVACVRPEETVLLEPEMDLYASGLIMLSLLQRSTEVAGSSKVSHVDGRTRLEWREVLRNTRKRLHARGYIHKDSQDLMKRLGA